MKKYILFFTLLTAIFTSCEDIIDVEVEGDEAQLVVDAWINNLPQPQIIQLRRTAPYFSNTFTPEVNGAKVTVFDDTGAAFEFQEDNNTGNYIWEPPTGEVFGQIERNYYLVVELDGEEYVSVSKMNRIMPVDSIGYEDREEELGNPAGIYAQFFARDVPGTGDAYWIKAFKNGVFLNKPSEINIAFDAGFSDGSTIDGVVFPVPIREAINRIPDSGDGAVDTADKPPYQIGDHIRVEIHSITPEAFIFWTRARTQMTLGDATIFAEPVSNVPTNIFPADSTNTKELPIGFFCVSAVEYLEIEIQ